MPLNMIYSKHKFNTRHSYIGNLPIIIFTDIVEDKPSIAQVIGQIGTEEKTICFISGENIDQFMIDINEVINKYSI